MARWSAPSPEVSNSRKMSMTSLGLRPRERSSSCILRTTWMASFSDHTVTKLLPTMASGIDMKSTPATMAAAAMAWPALVEGVLSP